MPAATEARRFRPAPRTLLLLLLSLGFETKCKRIVGTSPSSGETKETRVERERGFSAGTSQFSHPFMVPTDFFALFSRLIHTSPHEIRSSIPTCIIVQDTGAESSFFSPPFSQFPRSFLRSPTSLTTPALNTLLPRIFDLLRSLFHLDRESEGEEMEREREAIIVFRIVLSNATQIRANDTGRRTNDLNG